MKKRVVCLFSLILYLLTACTILSLKIEKEIATEVKIVTLKNRSGSFSFRPYVLFHDENGSHFYEVIDGTWESDPLIHELPPSSWTQFQNSVSYGGHAAEYQFVVAASRQPRDGEEVVIVKHFETLNDQCLYFYAGGVPQEITLPKNTQIIAQSENALLVNMTDAALPFFPRTEKTLDTTIDTADLAFSLTEAEMFLEELPLVAMVFAVLAAGIAFWGAACLMSIRSDENKRFIWINTMLVAGSLGLTAFLINFIDLPASMLPAENIFDWQYYRKELAMILEALEGFGRTNLLTIRDHAFDQAVTVFCGSMGCVGAVLIAEIIILVRNFRLQNSTAQ